jgi:hypothetical protein
MNEIYNYENTKHNSSYSMSFVMCSFSSAEEDTWSSQFISPSNSSTSDWSQTANCFYIPDITDILAGVPFAKKTVLRAWTQTFSSVSYHIPARLKLPP